MAKYYYTGTKVILRRKVDNPVEGLNYDYETFTSVNGDKMNFVWNKKNDFKATIPTKIEFVDEAKNRHIAHENYAQFLLNTHKGVFEVVGEVPEELIKIPTIQLSEADQLKKKIAELERSNQELKSKVGESVLAIKPVEPTNGKPVKEHWKKRQKRLQQEKELQT